MQVVHLLVTFIQQCNKVVSLQLLDGFCVARKNAIYKVEVREYFRLSSKNVQDFPNEKSPLIN